MERTHEEATKQYAPEEKVAILRRHLLEKEPISKLCDEVGLQPTVFYRWQKEFFENGAAAFEQKRPTNHSADQERIAYLQKNIQSLQAVNELGQCLCSIGHNARPLLALDQKARFLPAELESGSPGGFPERDTILGDQVQLGLCAPWGNTEKPSRLTPAACSDDRAHVPAASVSATVM